MLQLNIFMGRLLQIAWKMHFSAGEKFAKMERLEMVTDNFFIPCRFRDFSTASLFFWQSQTTLLRLLIQAGWHRRWRFWRFWWQNKWSWSWLKETVKWQQSRLTATVTDSTNNSDNDLTTLTMTLICNSENNEEVFEILQKSDRLVLGRDMRKTFGFDNCGNLKHVLRVGLTFKAAVLGSIRFELFKLGLACIGFSGTSRLIVVAAGNAGSFTDLSLIWFVSNFECSLRFFVWVINSRGSCKAWRLKFPRWLKWLELISSLLFFDFHEKHLRQSDLVGVRVCQNFWLI